MNEEFTPQADLSYDGVPGEPVVTAEAEAAQWVSDALFDAYNH